MKSALVFIVSIACNDTTRNDSKVSSTDVKNEVVLAVKELNKALINAQNTEFNKIVIQGLSYGHSS